MVLSFTNGNVTTDGTEQTVWNVTADKHFAGWLFLNNMEIGRASCRERV